MSNKKFYAVKIGRKPGVYKRWEDVQKEVLNFPGAIYRGFDNFEDAWQFLEEPTLQPHEITNRFNHLDQTKLPHLRNHKYATAYTDGSYDEATESYSYGVVLFWKNKMIQISRRFHNSENAALRNVAGELEGAKRAIQFAVSNKIKNLTLYYDYEGVASWADQKWRTNTPLTTEYQNFVRIAREQINIEFRWVKGHSGNRYNEMVDQLAKTATKEEYRQVENVEDLNKDARI
ncbi:ribonuclease HI [Entomoplasma freundtii]|uniref:ribonuclease H n=1 Tax=Entomoplasma freundtii TaxID=74700 RepID=A0A2K8NSQ7_9MOLU|nr:ribonuclease H family protein [Entomoplasma freundtii]ATZ16198.1 ribonuclease H [Entomoplasma freundtii]TDY56901.1 ribonuclease HI [Entomoplasma freundtii]